eukprot:TRINITY_DN2654_c1_g2_i1.p1 TRINITY_DN2654_c1_g2~~TRINITY_DN2654_c1_g2_i1.p1  ORF type:complete len:344 (-),score=91.30 TRINITY_DN2654_c1_g2_i1:215-1246(-)
MKINKIKFNKNKIPFGKFDTFRRFKSDSKRILLAGALGQIGTELVTSLRQIYGKENVFACDIKQPNHPVFDEGFYYADVRSYESLERLIVEKRIDWFINNASLLSVTAENNPQLALDVNIKGLHNSLDLAAKHKLRILVPSSIAAFGPSTPKVNTPNTTIMRPTTVYGVTKLYVELLGEYYSKRFGVDFRSLRYPGIISSETLPGGGTTDYAVDIFYKAIEHGKFECFLTEDSELPMMYMPDCLDGTIKLLQADESKIKSRTYNLGAISFTPKQIAEQIKKHIPNFEITYKFDALRQGIANSWPRSLDDTEARQEWGWQHTYTLEKMTADMLKVLTPRIKKQK